MVICYSMLLSHFDQSVSVGGYSRCCDICLRKCNIVYIIVVTIVMVTRVTTSHDDTDSGTMELSKEADQLFSAIQVVTIVTNINARACINIMVTMVMMSDSRISPKEQMNSATLSLIVPMCDIRIFILIRY